MRLATLVTLSIAAFAAAYDPYERLLARDLEARDLEARYLEDLRAREHQYLARMANPPERLFRRSCSSIDCGKKIAGVLTGDHEICRKTDPNCGGCYKKGSSWTCKDA